MAERISVDPHRERTPARFQLSVKGNSVSSVRAPTTSITITFFPPRHAFPLDLYSKRRQTTCFTPNRSKYKSCPRWGCIPEECRSQGLIQDNTTRSCYKAPSRNEYPYSDTSKKRNSSVVMTDVDMRVGNIGAIPFSARRRILRGSIQIRKQLGNGAGFTYQDSCLERLII